MFCSIEEAVDDFQQGRFLVLVDDEDRENEGDLILAAQFSTPQKVNQMGRLAGGMFMMTMTEGLLAQLAIPLIEPRHSGISAPRFGAPFDARRGIGTGISAADRSATILAALAPGAGPDDISIPGHVLPLAARPGGLAARRGHTEGSVGLAELAGLAPAAVMSEVLTEAGQMAKGTELEDFAERLDCKIISVEQIAQASV